MEPDKPTRYCLNCEYVLDGLPENRCPECGRRFDPCDPQSYGDGTPPRRSPLFPSGVSRVLFGWPFVVLFVWFQFFVPLCLPATVPLVAGAVVRYVARRQWRWAVATVGLCLLPMGSFVAWGIADYWLGAGTLRFIGFPGLESSNIDPVYRCGRQSRECRVYGAREVTDYCYNNALKAMIRCFGPMPGAYLGAYPTRQQASAALEGAAPADFELLLNDRVELPLGVYELDAGVAKDLLRGSPWGLAAEGQEAPESRIGLIGPITAAT